MDATRRHARDHVSILSDDGPADDMALPRLHIVAGDDYYLSIGPGERPAFESVRVCTDGMRDPAITHLFAALWHYAQGRGEQAAACAGHFAEIAKETK